MYNRIPVGLVRPVDGFCALFLCFFAGLCMLSSSSCFGLDSGFGGSPVLAAHFVKELLYNGSVHGWRVNRPRLAPLAHKLTPKVGVVVLLLHALLLNNRSAMECIVFEQMVFFGKLVMTINKIHILPTSAFGCVLVTLPQLRILQTRKEGVGEVGLVLYHLIHPMEASCRKL